MNRKFVIYCVVFLAVAFAGFQAWDYSKADNINSRFTDGVSTLNTLTATNVVATSGTITTGTVTTLTSTTANLTTANISALYATQPVVQAAGDTVALTAAQTGSLVYARPLAKKGSRTLPAAAAGLYFDVFVADTDTLRLVAASGDSILVSTGAADRAIGTVAGTCRIVALDAVRWLVTNAIGTWTQDHGTN
jgi:hypothetical protein